MKQYEDAEHEVRYLVQIVCLGCKAELTLITNESSVYSNTRKNDLIFGPCKECNSAFLQVVGI